MVKKKKIVLPPQLPPEIAEDEIEVSDEDLQFVGENRAYAGFVSRLDTQSITRHVTRVADVKEDALEALYEKRLEKKLLEKKVEEDGNQVDPVDALPIKTLDGKICYRTALKEPKKSEDAPDEEDGNVDRCVPKPTKAERRAKLKKNKKEAKKQTREPDITAEEQKSAQAEVLAEVKEDLTAEELFARKKSKLAELGMALLADPESNIKSLNEMIQLCKDKDHKMIKLGLLSLLAVFKDIIPGYRIRLPTDKEKEMTISKAVKKTRLYESTLLMAYKAYLQKLMALEKQPMFQHIVIRCFCTLLDAASHFNFRESLLSAVSRNISSADVIIRKLCCATIKALFINEGKHGGEATVEAVRLIAVHVKTHDCLLHPDSIEVFLSLSFDEDLGRSKSTNEESVKNKKKRRMKNFEKPSQLRSNDKKKSRQELLEKTREEVNAEFKAYSFTPDVLERRKMQSETLSSVFETYFRILKHAMQPADPRSKLSASLSGVGAGIHPLLSPCLSGLGKFSHLIDLDYMGDLLNSLKMLASGVGISDGSPDNCLTISERLRCCIVAFKVMRNNLDALNVDLQEFFVQFYNLLVEYRPGREDEGEVLAEALKTMLCEGRQHDMQRAAAFIKRLATFSLCFGSAESMAALVTLRHLLQKNIKCQVLLENDPDGGSVSGSAVKYHPDASDPNLSGALTSVLWELNLLSKHYHPAVSTMASSISNMNTAHNQVYLATASPREAFMDFSLERESFIPKSDLGALARKRKRRSASSISTNIGSIQDELNPVDEKEVRKRFSEHFIILRDIAENEKLRSELNHTMASISLYKEYKRQRKKGSKTRHEKNLSAVK